LRDTFQQKYNLEIRTVKPELTPTQQDLIHGKDLWKTKATTTTTNKQTTTQTNKQTNNPKKEKEDRVCVMRPNRKHSLSLSFRPASPSAATYAKRSPSSTR